MIILPESTMFSKKALNSFFLELLSQEENNIESSK